MSEHLTAAELELALNKEVSPERLAEIGRHLVERCQPCRILLATAYCPSQEPLTLEEGAEYDRAIASAIQYAVHSEELFNHGDPLIRAAAMIAAAEVTHRSTEKSNPLHTFEELLKRSWAARHDRPREMVELATTAVHVAQGLDPAIHGAAKVVDYQARAWGELGNAHRAADQLWEAEQAFGKAFQFLKSGTDDRSLKARLYDLYSSLLGTQRKFDLAFQFLDVVFALYQEINDPHSAGRTLITKAVYTHYSGRSEEALTINQRGLALINEKRDPALPALALLNQLWFLLSSGCYKDAKILLFKNRRRINAGGRILTIKLRWLEGQISYGMGAYGLAEAAYQEVKEEFEAESLGFSAALASLDIAMAQMRQGKLAEAKERVVEAAGVFSALNIHREVLGAVELLKDAFRIDKATITLVERVVSYVREWESNPAACFLSSPE